MEVDRCQEYMDALEEERRKILVFQRELPLSLHLVSQAIDVCRRQMTLEMIGARSESEETSGQSGPVFEEFIPIRMDPDDTLRENRKEDDDKPDERHGNRERDKKHDWLRFVQLWNQDVGTSPKEDELRGIARPNSDTKDKYATADSCCQENLTPANGQLQRKARRCWSVDLHRRFLHALEQLGGSRATPKQIRELMKVDGLTNDEIKSHLQKYRLHTIRMPSPPIPPNNPQPAQFLVVSGIWVAPEYTEVASSGQAMGAAISTTFFPSTATTVALATRAASTPVKKRL